MQKSSMSDKQANRNERTGAIKNEQTRQRWELFHRAIAHAKQSTVSAMEEVGEGATAARPLPLEIP